MYTLYIILYSLMIILPFIWGFIHSRFYKNHNLKSIYANYFISVNIVFSYFILAYSLVFFSQETAKYQGWVLSESIVQFGLVIFAISFISFISLFKNNVFKQVVCGLLAVMLLLNSLNYILSSNCFDLYRNTQLCFDLLEMVIFYIFYKRLGNGK